MNIVLLVIDSLRACSLRGGQKGGAEVHTPFFARLQHETLSFERAYATECWTLPTHLSMFTGLLPSQHGAHFQTMGYSGAAPTIAEILAAVGFHTELVTRNFVFDGTVPGVTRGFQVVSRPLAAQTRLEPTALFLALAKPRVREHVRATGFFHPHHSDKPGFLRTFARTLLPADELALERVLAIMQRRRRAGGRYFVCCNLYDVHAPYAPARDSLLRPWTTRRAMAENLAVPLYLSKLGRHAYLRDNFRMSSWGQQLLRERYHRAVELMDAKIASFYWAAEAAGLLDDTLLIVTSDHGEAFGEHGLYLHDASVYDTHLRVPLWIRHPSRAPEVVADVVSMRDLFGVMLAAAGERPEAETILSPAYRADNPIAVAEHFYYPRCADAAVRYRQNLLAIVADREKFITRKEGVWCYDIRGDPKERSGVLRTNGLGYVVDAIRRSGGARAVTEAVVAHTQRWQQPDGGNLACARRAA